MLRPLTWLMAAITVLSAHSVARGTVIGDAIASMPSNSWRKISVNRLSDVLAAEGQRPAEYKPLSQIYSWTGSAWDGARGSLYFWGGDFNGHEGNEVHVFSALTGQWRRGSLPSQVASNQMYRTTVDGVNNAPVAGESYDNIVFLRNANRLGVIGVSRDGETWRDTNGDIVGPYLWDPAKSDANKVGGLTGSQVDPAAYPGVTGGQMWQNRNNGVAMNGGFGKHAHGTSDSIVVAGADVVYVTDEFANLWRYTVTNVSLPLTDVWEHVGMRPITGETGWGSGAIDTVNMLYLKTLGATEFGFWDVKRIGPAENNRATLVRPTILPSGASAPDFRYFGIEYDPTQRAFVLWNGSAAVWVLRPPSVLDSNRDGYADAGAGWTLERLAASGDLPSIPSAYVGVFGKWNYMEEYGAFIGVIDPVSADVYVYKPSGVVTPPPRPPRRTKPPKPTRLVSR